MPIRNISRDEKKKKKKYNPEEKYQWNESFKYEAYKTKNF